MAHSNPPLSEFSAGVGEFSSGIGELSEGTNTLTEEVSDLPDMLNAELDSMKEQYLPSDFETISFTSNKNTNTEFVQFVLQCEGISLPEIAVEEEQKEEPTTFIDRLLALFTGT